MTEVEIKERIDSLETRRFYINMVERWTNEDRKMLREIEKELAELKRGEKNGSKQKSRKRNNQN